MNTPAPQPRVLPVVKNATVENVADSSKVFKNPEEAMAYLEDLKAQGKNPTVKVNNAGTVNTEYVISNGKPQPPTPSPYKARTADFTAKRY